MDPLEKAIRNAFEKGDPTAVDFRKKVYRSALASLERAIDANPNIGKGQADARRLRLKETIKSIETEFRAALPTAETTSAAASSDAPVVGAAVPGRVATSADTPVLDTDERRDHEKAGRQANGEATRAEPVTGLAGSKPHRAKRGGLFLPFLIGTVIMLGGLYYLYSTRDISRTAPVTQETTRGEAVATGETRAGTTWISVFNPADPTAAVASSGTLAEAVTLLDRTYLRVTPDNAGSGTVTFDVGEGVLAQLAGQRAIFEISAKSGSDESVPFSVECDFRSLGDCGRKRYLAGPAPGNYLFEIELPDTTPGGAGRLSMAITGAPAGSFLDVSSVRVAVADQP